MLREAGFTLFEIVVALAIMAMAMALVAPASFRMLAAWQDSSDVGRVLKRVASLPLSARTEGRPLRLGPDTPQERMTALFELPEDWRLELDTVLLVHANGACEGAEATLVTERQSIPLRIEAPFCRPERD